MKKINKSEIRQILQQRFENDIHKKLCDLPLPERLKDNFKAAHRIKEAFERKEKIAVVGDYDVDGIISCVIMAEFLEDLDFNYVIKIPNRFKDGYGISKNLIEELGKIDLIITVDNGIAAFEASELCKQKNIDLIITDHHTPLESLPKAYAIINPKQKDCPFPEIEICGAQVAWYLCGAIKEVFGIKYDLSKFLELLAIAIIADMMEARDLNRTLIRRGIERINSSNRAAFCVIKENFKKEKIDTDDICFIIAPLINSAGRMDDAMFSFNFLRAKNKTEALKFLEQIKNFNQIRKDEENKLFNESLSQVCDDDDCVIVSGQNWHDGVLGIVSSRLAKQFKKPAFVFSLNENKLKGSARSVGKIDILALISQTKDLLSAYGGHKGAAGLNIEKANFELFKKKMNEICAQIPKDDFLDRDEILGALDLKEIDYEMLEILQSFEPFGYKNPRPLFVLEKVKIKSKKAFGRDGKHLKLVLFKDGKNLDALFFNFNKEPEIGDELNIIGSIFKNEFHNLISVQFTIQEIL